MHNQVFLIGRIVEEPTITKDDNEKSKLFLKLAVQRGYKNEDGIDETDFIKCILWNSVATHTSEYCHKGDLVGIKGRLQTRSYEENSETKYITEVIVDRITFLANKTNDNEIER